ncbi:MAG TPA: hypothetical protein PLJ34_10005 [Hyphomicrobiales bacterium]|nr:hypothetical protein [Hyphomicrobiales bacterium]
MKLAASLAGADGLAARLAGRLDGRAIEESLVASADDAIAAVRKALAPEDSALADGLRVVVRAGAVDIVAPAEAAFSREFGTMEREAEPFAGELAGTARAALESRLRDAVCGTGSRLLGIVPVWSR